MKRLIAFFVFSVFMLIPLFSQPEIPVPTSVVQWVGMMPIYLGSIYGVYISAPFWVAALLGILNLTEASKTVKYIFTVIVSGILLLLAYFLDFGFLNGSPWWHILTNLVGVMGIQILGYAVIKAALDAIAEKFNFWKPSR